MKLFQRLGLLRRWIKAGDPAPERISRHILRDIGRDPMALRYPKQAQSTSQKRDPWCLAS